MIRLLDLLGEGWTATHDPLRALVTIERIPTSLLLSNTAAVGLPPDAIALLAREMAAAHDAGAGRIWVEHTCGAGGRLTAKWVPMTPDP